MNRMTANTSTASQQLSQLGFRFNRSGAHISRTMMLDELTDLLAYVDQPEADKSDYAFAIKEENCLGKRSRITRTLTHKHLVELYALERDNTLFRTLLYFWNRDVQGRPLLALMCAYARDPVLRPTARFILNVPKGERVTRESLEAFIDNIEPNRFSPVTLTSTAQHINSTWTKSGHLRGQARKVRAAANPTAGSVAYAIFLSFLTGARGPALLQTEYAKLLDCAFGKAAELAEEASRRGWIVFKRMGDVIEAQFPNLLTHEQLERLREQN